MKNKLAAKIYFCSICALGLMSFCVFICSLFSDLSAEDLEWFEQAARIVGYILVLAMIAFSAADVFYYIKHSVSGKYINNAAVFALTSIILLCAHDILLYEAYGNQLEGTYTMTAFFAMDAGLLILYPTAVALNKKRPASKALYCVSLSLIIIFVLYMIGDMAGYPASKIIDWDEAILKFLLLCHTLTLCLFTNKNTAKQR